MLQKVLDFLKEYDFTWTIPISFIVFILYPVFGQLIWGEGFSMYPPDFFHAAIYTILVNVTFVSAIQMMIFFHFPEMYNYYLKDFKDIQPIWLKPIIFLSVFFFTYLMLLVTFLAIV